MPRAKANPDPRVVEYERQRAPGGRYTIEARRDGSFTISQEGKVIAQRASQLGAWLGASRYPSNRMQDDALESAKSRIEGMLLPAEK